MPEAYIIDAVCTAVGKRNGSLAHVHPTTWVWRHFVVCSAASTSTRRP
jgi:hypothetical protein